MTLNQWRSGNAWRQFGSSRQGGGRHKPLVARGREGHETPHRAQLPTTKNHPARNVHRAAVEEPWYAQPSAAKGGRGGSAVPRGTQVRQAARGSRRRRVVWRGGPSAPVFSRAVMILDSLLAALKASFPPLEKGANQGPFSLRCKSYPEARNPLLRVTGSAEDLWALSHSCLEAQRGEHTLSDAKRSEGQSGP